MKTMDLYAKKIDFYAKKIDFYAQIIIISLMIVISLMLKKMDFILNRCPCRSLCAVETASQVRDLCAKTSVKSCV